MYCAALIRTARVGLWAAVLAAAAGMAGTVPAVAQEKGGEAVFASIEIPSLNPLHASSATGLVSPQILRHPGASG